MSPKGCEHLQRGDRSKGYNNGNCKKDMAEFEIISEDAL